MLRLKLIPAAVIALGLAVASGYAQRPDSVSYEKPIQYKIVVTNSPPKAFALLGNVLWYATDEMLVSQPLNARTHQTFKTMGNIASTGITSVVADAMGRVWAGGDEGVAVRVGNTFTSYTSADGLPEGKILAMAAGTGGEVWAGTENGAARFRDGSWTKFTTEQGLPNNKVQALIADSKGKIYIGTPRGLAVYDGVKFETFNARNTGSNGLEWNNITVLAVEPERDVVWMTDGPANVVNYDGKTWNRFLADIKDITSIMNDTRRTWFGAPDGIHRFNGETWTSSPNEHGVQAQQVFAMLRDKDGNLLFAMERGVLVMDNPYRR